MTTPHVAVRALVELRDFEGHTAGPWEVWTSNSWRRIGARHEGKTVCEPITQNDGHPDLVFRNGGEDGPDARLLVAGPALLAEVMSLRMRLSEAQRVRDEDHAVGYREGHQRGAEYAGRMRESLEWALALVSDWAPTQFYNMDDYRKAVAFLVPNPNPAGPPSDAAPSGATDGNEASPPQTGEASGPVGLGPTMADEQGDPRIGDTFLTRTWRRERVAVVPVEPTEEMHAAAAREWDGRMCARSAGVWKAMLDAAPSEHVFESAMPLPCVVDCLDGHRFHKGTALIHLLNHLARVDGAERTRPMQESK